ncbi:MAG: K(+)-transporting ATPase subunit C [Chitinophagaceae bacterium]|nr:K(+)-transporting ATPase subunit C [Chitinophagaceae bacterium]
MKKYILISAKLTLVFIILCCVIYPLILSGVGKLTPGKGKGETLVVDGKVVGYANVGQKFDKDIYFWGRPSAVNYNAAGSGGSNKGPSNPDYLKDVQTKIDTFLTHHPGVKKEDIPAELVTCSGSGLDPDLSPAAVKIQIRRVAAARRMSEVVLTELIEKQTERPFLGLFGPSKVNVLKLNIALDKLNKS